MTTMTDAELTFLGFVADALVAFPKANEKTFEEATQEDCSDEYATLLESLQSVFARYKPKTTMRMLRIIEKLQASSETVTKRTGHVLKWGVPEEYYCDCSKGAFVAKKRGGLCASCLER